MQNTVVEVPSHEEIRNVNKSLKTKMTMNILRVYKVYNE